MASHFGYAVSFTDRPEVWRIDGYVSIGSSGAPSIATVPSGIINSVVRNSTGNYTIILNQSWFALLSAQVCTEIPSGSSPANLAVQLESDTVGNASVLPKSAGGVGQGVTFHCYVPSTGTATDPPAGSGLRFSIVLKNTDA